MPVDSVPSLNQGDEQHSHQLRLHDCNPTEKQGKYFIFNLVGYFFQRTVIDKQNRIIRNSIYGERPQKDEDGSPNSRHLDQTVALERTRSCLNVCAKLCTETVLFHLNKLGNMLLKKSVENQKRFRVSQNLTMSKLFLTMTISFNLNKQTNKQILGNPQTKNYIRSLPLIQAAPVTSVFHS